MSDIICGIYYIENLVNGKKYVGQSIDMFREWKDQHLCALKNNRHYNIHLQNSYNKYGKENFKHVVVEECDKQLLDEKEIYYIKYLKSHRTENGYNITWGGFSFKEGMKHTEETKKKMSESRKGKSPSEEWIIIDNLTLTTNNNYGKLIKL